MIVISNHKVYFAVTVCRKQRVQAVKNGKTDHHSWQGQGRGQDQLEDLGEDGDDQRRSQEILNEIDDIIANTSNSEKVAQTKT